MRDRIEKRRKKRIRKRFFQRIIILAIAIVLGYNLFGMLMEIGGIIKVRYKEVSYIELIKFSNNDILAIKDRKQIRDILGEIKKIKGKISTEEIQNESDVVFINIYDRSLNKTEIINKGHFMSVDGIWYDVGKIGFDRFNKIIENYY